MKGKNLLALMMAVLMTVSMFPQSALTARAEEAQEEILKNEVELTQEEETLPDEVRPADANSEEASEAEASEAEATDDKATEDQLSENEISINGDIAEGDTLTLNVAVSGAAIAASYITTKAIVKRGGEGDNKDDLVYPTLPIASEFTGTEGYTFKGWYTLPNPTDADSPVTSGDLATTTTLYAVFNLISYNVSYYYGSGMLSSDFGTLPTTYTVEDEDIILPGKDDITNTYSDRMSAAGWYTNYSYTEPSSPITKIDKAFIKTLEDGTYSIYLYLKWKGEEYTITFDPNGGTVNPTTKVYEVGNSYSNMPIPTKEGYDFVCWCTSVKGGTPISRRDLVQPTNRTFYAMWYSDEHPYTVTDMSSDENKAKYTVELDPAKRGEDYNITLMPKAGYTVTTDTKVYYYYEEGVATHVDANKMGQARRHQDMANVFTISEGAIVANMKIVVTGLSEGSTITFPTIENRIGYEIFTPGYSGSTVEQKVTGVKKSSEKYSFEIKISEDGKKTSDFAVKADGKALTAKNGVYTVDFSKDRTITVEGVVIRKVYPVTLSNTYFVSVSSNPLFTDDFDDVSAYSDEDFVFYVAKEEDAVGTPVVTYKLGAGEEKTITPNANNAYVVPKSAFENVATNTALTIKFAGLKQGVKVSMSRDSVSKDLYVIKDISTGTEKDLETYVDKAAQLKLKITATDKAKNNIVVAAKIKDGAYATLAKGEGDVYTLSFDGASAYSGDIQLKISGLQEKTARAITFKEAAGDSQAVVISVREDNRAVTLSPKNTTGNMGTTASVGGDAYATITPQAGYKIVSVTYTSSVTTTAKAIKASGGEYKIPKEEVEAQEVVITTTPTYYVKNNGDPVTKLTVDPNKAYTFSLHRGDSNTNKTKVAKVTITDSKKVKHTEVVTPSANGDVVFAIDSLKDYAGTTITLELESDDKATIIDSDSSTEGNQSLEIETAAKTAKATLTVLPADISSISVVGVKDGSIKQPYYSTRKYLIKLSKGANTSNLFVEQECDDTGYTFDITEPDAKGNCYLSVDVSYTSSPACQKVTVYYDPKGKQASYTSDAKAALKHVSLGIIADDTEMRAIQPTVAVTAITDVTADLKLTNNKKSLNDVGGVYYIVKAVRADAANMSDADKTALDAKMNREVYKVVAMDDKGIATTTLNLAVDQTDHTKSVGGVKYTITAVAVQAASAPTVTNETSFNAAKLSTTPVSKAVTATTKKAAYATKLTIKARKVNLYAGMDFPAEGIVVADVSFDKNCTYPSLGYAYVSSITGLSYNPPLTISADKKSIILRAYPVEDGAKTTSMEITACANAAGYELNMVKATVKINGYGGDGDLYVTETANVYKPVNKAATAQVSILGNYPKQMISSTKYEIESVSAANSKYVTVSNKGKVTIAKNVVVDKVTPANNVIKVKTTVTLKDGKTDSDITTITLKDTSPDLKLSVKLSNGQMYDGKSVIDPHLLSHAWLRVEGDFDGSETFTVSTSKTGAGYDQWENDAYEDYGYYMLELHCASSGNHTYTITSTDGSKKSAKITIKTKSTLSSLYVDEDTGNKLKYESGAAFSSEIVEKNKPLELYTDTTIVKNPEAEIIKLFIKPHNLYESLEGKPVVKGGYVHLIYGDVIQGATIYVVPTSNKITISCGKDYSIIINVPNFKAKADVTLKTTKFTFSNYSTLDESGEVEIPVTDNTGNNVYLNGFTLAVNPTKTAEVDSDKWEAATKLCSKIKVIGPIVQGTGKKMTKTVKLSYLNNTDVPAGTYNLLLIPTAYPENRKAIPITVTIAAKLYTTKTVIKDTYTITDSKVKLEPKKAVAGETIVINNSGLYNTRDNDSTVNSFTSVFEIDPTNKDTIRVKEGVDLATVDEKNLVGYVNYHILSKDGIPGAYKTIKITITK